MTTQQWAAALAAYDVAMRASGKAPGTIRLHRYRIADLAERFPSPGSITEDDLLRILAEHRETWAPETRKSVRGSWRSFFRWAAKTGRIPVDPAADLDPVPVPRGLPRPVPDKVIRQSLRRAEEREQFMLELGAYAGLRCMEIARVHGDDWDGRRLRVVGKGGKVRFVYIVHESLVARLDELEGWAFPNPRTGEPITAGYVSKLLSRALLETYTGHTLRHRYGTVGLDGTDNVAAVGEQMGHANINTTLIYTRVSERAMLAVAQAVA